MAWRCGGTIQLAWMAHVPIDPRRNADPPTPAALPECVKRLVECFERFPERLEFHSHGLLEVALSIECTLEEFDRLLRSSQGEFDPRHPRQVWPT